MPCPFSVISEYRNYSVSRWILPILTLWRFSSSAALLHLSAGAFEVKCMSDMQKRGIMRVGAHLPSMGQPWPEQ